MEMQTRAEQARPLLQRNLAGIYLFSSFICFSSITFITYHCFILHRVISSCLLKVTFKIYIFGYLSVSVHKALSFFFCKFYRHEKYLLKSIYNVSIYTAHWISTKIILHLCNHHTQNTTRAPQSSCMSLLLLPPLSWLLEPEINFAWFSDLYSGIYNM